MDELKRSDRGWRLLEEFAASVAVRSAVANQKARELVVSHLRRGMLPNLKTSPGAVDWPEFKRRLSDLTAEDLDFARSMIRAPLVTAGLRGWNGPQVGWVPLELHESDIDRFPRADLTSTAGAESNATRHLAALLSADPEMSRDTAKDACREFAVSNRGFLDRVWPKAREAAGLSAVARAGRKKSTR